MVVTHSMCLATDHHPTNGYMAGSIQHIEYSITKPHHDLTQLSTRVGLGLYTNRMRRSAMEDFYLVVNTHRETIATNGELRRFAIDINDRIKHQVSAVYDPRPAATLPQVYDQLIAIAARLNELKPNDTIDDIYADFCDLTVQHQALIEGRQLCEQTMSDQSGGVLFGTGTRASCEIRTNGATTCQPGCIYC